ncbi:MAG: hypothetical protein R3F56_20680 [Planctomycetota bacterium]
MRNLLPLLFLAPFASHPCLAQGVPLASVEARGPHASIPLAICLPGNHGTILLKSWGDQSSPPQPIAAPTTAGVPDFSATAMFGSFAQEIDIDAMSTGNDLLPLVHQPLEPSSWYIDPDPNSNDGWVAFLFSVRKNTAGSSDGIVWQRAPVANGAGGDVYGVFVEADTDPSSEGIPSELVDHVVLEQGGEHIGFSAPLPDVVAVDPFIPRIAAGFHNSNSNNFLVNNALTTTGSGTYIAATFYFSLTPSSAAVVSTLRVNNVSWVGAMPNRALTGADVLAITWNGTSWSNPYVYRTYEMFGLDPGADIDSLCVDVVDDHTTFSLCGSPLLSAHWPSHPAPQTRPVRRTSDGQPIRLVNTGDVDSICAFDPERAMFHRMHGIPVASAVVVPAIGLSVAANADLTGYHAIVSGWKTGSTPVDGTIRLYVSFNGGAPMQIGLPVQRSRADSSVPFYLPYTWPSSKTSISLVATFQPAGSPDLYWTWVVKLRN